MGSLAAGEVVFLPFPYTDLSFSKRRPVVLVAYVDQGDWIVCQVTSNPSSDSRSVELTQSDFAVGSLKQTSYARPGKLFTANESLITAVSGSLTRIALDRLRVAIIAVILNAEI